MPQLTPEQVKQYYAQEGKKPKPLSPLDWLAQQSKESTASAIQPSPVLPGLGAATVTQPSAIGTEIATRAEAEPETEKSKLEGQLARALAKPTTTLREEKATLEEKAGIAGKKAIVGSFEEEVAKTQTLLDQLEQDITTRTRDYLVSEPQRRRVLASEQEPLTKQLGILERGLGTAQAGLQRSQQDILTELGLIERERSAPLETLQREIDIRTKIKDLTEKDIPNTVTSQFNDEGDLTIVTQDPATGKYSTQTIKGVGKKAEKYVQYSTDKDAEGNLTIIGITRDGKSEIIGTYKGVGKATKTDQTRVDELTTYFDSRKNAQGKVSNDDYIAAQRNWISGGGNVTDFKSAFPTDMIEESELTRANVSSLYGIPDDKERSGFLNVWGNTNSEKIDKIMEVIKKYKDVGYTNAQILKMIQEQK